MFEQDSKEKHTINNQKLTILIFPILVLTNFRDKLVIKLKFYDNEVRYGLRKAEETGSVHMIEYWVWMLNEDKKS